MIGQLYFKGQSNDVIHNRYVKTKTTQERLLKRTLHIWSSSFYIHRRKLEKDRSWLKRERNFAQKTNAHLWRRCTAIYAPFFQIMRLRRRARGYPNPCKLLEGIHSFSVIFNHNHEKHRKKYSEIQGQLKLYQTVYFLSRNSKYKPRKSGVLWPLLFVYFSLTSHHIIGSIVSMSVKYKPWHRYGTL